MSKNMEFKIKLNTAELTKLEKYMMKEAKKQINSQQGITSNKLSVDGELILTLILNKYNVENSTELCFSWIEFLEIGQSPQIGDALDELKSKKCISTKSYYPMEGPHIFLTNEGINYFDEKGSFNMYPECENLLKEIITINKVNPNKQNLGYLSVIINERYKDCIDEYKLMEIYKTLKDNNYVKGGTLYGGDKLPSNFSLTLKGEHYFEDKLLNKNNSANNSNYYGDIYNNYNSNNTTNNYNSVTIAELLGLLDNCKIHETEDTSEINSLLIELINELKSDKPKKSVLIKIRNSLSDGSILITVGTFLYSNRDLIISNINSLLH